MHKKLQLEKIISPTESTKKMQSTCLCIIQVK